MAFLTLEDPNAKIKGSRDPLGLQPVWVSFARHLISNLTTQTTSVRGFTIFILGRYFANLLVEDRALSREKVVDAFLRMEQLGAYARFVKHDVQDDIRGIERVKAFVNDNKGKVHIESNKRGMILSDQKVYGLWGFYSVPARVSGIIPDGPLGIESNICKFIEKNYLPILSDVMTPLRTLLVNGGQINVKNSRVIDAISEILIQQFTKNEFSFYSDYVSNGLYVSNGSDVESGEGDRQARFCGLLKNYTELESRVGREEVALLKEKAEKSDKDISSYLDRILCLESLLAPADEIFNFVLTQNEQTPKEVSSKLINAWGRSLPNINADNFDTLVPEIESTSSKPIATAMKRCYSSLANGDYSEAIMSILEWNKSVMENRKSSPWVLLSDRGRIDVRYKGLDSILPDGDKLPTLWRNGYFIDSLKNILSQLRNVR
jgi:hypothetical protein